MSKKQATLFIRVVRAKIFVSVCCIEAVAGVLCPMHKYTSFTSYISKKGIDNTLFP